MSNERYEYIEVKRILSDESGISTKTQKETLKTSAVEAFRDWRKTEKNKAIAGDITLLVLTSQKPLGDSGGARTILIEENYEDFIYRLNERVPVNRIV